MTVCFTEGLRPKSCHEGVQNRAIYKYENFEKKIEAVISFKRRVFAFFGDFSTTKR